MAATKASPVVIIVGAGPAGLVAAATFAQRCCTVEVHDKRGPPDVDTKNVHSFIIALNQKGIRALQSAGLDTAQQRQLVATLRHPPGSKRAYVMMEPKPGAVIAVERNEMTAQLYSVVKKCHPNNIKFVFYSSCQGVDLHNKTVLLGPAPAEGQPFQATPIKYDLLIGADGAHSAVRTSLVEALPGQFECNVRKAPLMYKRYHHLSCDADLTGKYTGGAVMHFFGIKLPPSAPAPIPPATKDASAVSAAAPNGSLGPTAATSTPAGPATASGLFNDTAAATAGASVPPVPSGAKASGTAAGAGGRGKVDSAVAGSSGPGTGLGSVASAPAAPAAKAAAGQRKGGKAGPSLGFATLINNSDGTVSGGISVFSWEQHKLQHAKDYEECLRQTPIPPTTIKVMAEHLAAAPWTWAGSWVRCSQLHGPGGVLLIGDAAHAVSPSMGQGCNAALEDVTVLQQLLTEYDNAAGFEGLPEEFTKRRLEDVLALVWMDENAGAFRGQKGIFNSNFIMYSAHTIIRGKLHRLAPKLIAKPAMHEVWETPVPYTTILKQMRADGVTFGLVAAAGLTAVAAATVSWMMRGRSSA